MVYIITWTLSPLPGEKIGGSNFYLLYQKWKKSSENDLYLGALEEEVSIWSFPLLFKILRAEESVWKNYRTILKIQKKALGMKDIELLHYMTL